MNQFRTTEMERRVLTPEAVAFLNDLEQEFGWRRGKLLADRQARQTRLDGGERPDFLPDTREVRESDWVIETVPDDLADRRVEITGPVDAKMMINALNSGARVFMADFEDATSPTWQNLLEGQANLVDAYRGELSFETEEKTYQVGEDPATLLVRPRGWHLDEKHFLVDGRPMSGSLFDFGLYLFHGGRAAIEAGTGPYLYLPKLESHLEARLWNDVFVWAQDRLDIPVEPSRPRCSSKRSSPHSRWTRSSTSCASTPPASMRGDGTTSSRSSRSSGTTPRSCSRTGPPSR
jgi:malate synthase